MNKLIDNIRKVRISLLEQVSNLSDDTLNEVPAGFNNNIVWNVGHLITVQQGVCYLRAGLKPFVDEQYTAAYKPGTKPEKYIGLSEIESIKKLLLSSLGPLEEDYSNHIFSNYPAWTTRYGVELSNIDDALAFLGFHEGLHTGYIMALKRVVSKDW